MELIIDVGDSLMSGLDGTTECTPENSGNSSHNEAVKIAKRITKDLNSCRQAYAIMESGNGKQITPFITTADYVDDRNRRSTAFQIRGPFGLFVDVTGCVTDKDRNPNQK